MIRCELKTIFSLCYSSGSYEIAEADGMNRGTKIIIHLKGEDKRFSLKATVEGNGENFQLRECYVLIFVNPCFKTSNQKVYDSSCEFENWTW